MRVRPVRDGGCPRVWGWAGPWVPSGATRRHSSSSADGDAASSAPPLSSGLSPSPFLRPSSFTSARLLRTAGRPACTCRRPRLTVWDDGRGGTGVGWPLRVLIAPDCFGDSLTAVQAAQAIATAGGRSRPADDLTLAPQSDGGPGFVDVLASRLGELRTLGSAGRWTADVDADWVFDDAIGHRLHRVCAGLRPGAARRAADGRRPRSTAHSTGVGQLIGAALAAGAGRIVVGLGGSACTDGGRGLVGGARRAGRGPRPAGRRRADRRHRRRTPAARSDGRGAPCSDRRKVPTRHRGAARGASDGMGRRTRRGGRPAGQRGARRRRGRRHRRGVAGPGRPTRIRRGDHRRVHPPRRRRRRRRADHHRRGPVRRPVAARQSRQRAGRRGPA